MSKTRDSEPTIRVPFSLDLQGSSQFTIIPRHHYASIQELQIL